MQYSVKGFLHYFRVKMVRFVHQSVPILANVAGLAVISCGSRADVRVDVWHERDRLLGMGMRNLCYMHWITVGISDIDDGQRRKGQSSHDVPMHSRIKAIDAMRVCARFGDGRLVKCEDVCM